MGRYKIAVYTIALNEEKHVKRWFNSAKEADLLVIADTGSTDKTRFLARSLGVSVTEIAVEPWRFDVARNASLALIPEEFDICIQLDMDEILHAGWRDKVEEAYDLGNVWPIYKHVNSRDENGIPRHYQDYFKIHPRKGFYWKYPIHEVLVQEVNLPFKRESIDLEVDHIKDFSKSRESYLDLLETAVLEEPHDWRMNHYLNREYFYNQNWLKVIETSYRCEKIPNGWDVERASTYMWASEAAHQLLLPPLAEEWARKATDVAPNFYEAWHWRAHIAHLNNKWEECLEYSKKRLMLERQSHHLVKPEVWEWWGYDLMALSHHKLGLNAEALLYGETAYFANPRDQRLRNNLDYYRQAIRSTDRPIIELTDGEKLLGFPMIRIISLTDAHDRKRKMTEKLRELPELEFKYIEATPCASREYQDIHNAVLVSHLEALEDFLENSTDDWTLIAEDDLNFDLVQYWPFTWREKLEHLQTHKIEIAQLSVYTKRVEDLDSELHPRKSGYDWSCAAYLVSRVGAAKILNKSMSKDCPVEENLFTGMGVFSEALFTCDVDNDDAFHAQYQESIFRPGFEKAINNMKMRFENSHSFLNSTEKLWDSND
jgi:glycosyltransferase involved in cell wall biosynthesis